MLHDIGIFLTHGTRLRSAVMEQAVHLSRLSRKELPKEGYPKHAIVCETHVGVGLTIKDIEKKKFPVPGRDMTPTSIEEKNYMLCRQVFEGQ